MTLFPQDSDGLLKTFVRGVFSGMIVTALFLAIACMGKYLAA